MSKYYVGQRLRMKALEQDQGSDLPNEFVVTFVGGETSAGWIGVQQVRAKPGTLDTWRLETDLDALFEPIPETAQAEPLNRGLADPA